MKKIMVRIVAALLVAMLALTLLPMGAFAKEAIDVYEGYTDDSKPVYDSTGDPKNGSFFNSAPIEIGADNKVLNTSDYDKHYVDPATGEIYDLDQFYLVSVNNKGKYNTTAMGQSIVIDGVPTKDSDLAKWKNKYKYIDLWYVAHQHSLSRWYSDGTTHWKECLTCKKYLGMYNQFMYQNWCQDGDEDGICNVCGGDVPYHDVTVIEEKGGKITVNRDNACHRMKITADVEPAEGYKLKKLHFTKVRDDGSEQEITRYKKNGQFWTYMPTYDLEVSAEFVKVKTKK